MKSKFGNMGSLNLRNFEISKPRNQELLKPRNQESLKPRNQVTKKPRNQYFFIFKKGESPAPLNIPTPSPASDHPPGRHHERMKLQINANCFPIVVMD